MHWSYEHVLLYHYIEYKKIELVWIEHFDLPQLDFKVTIVVGM